NNSSNYLLTDQRFSGLFSDPDFEIVEDSEQYKQLAPMMKKLEVKKKKNEKRIEEKERNIQNEEMTEMDNDNEFST
uniref:NUC153 domain-containing protein n=1 Tax=Meloidogyne javanica TaxID=6303 RepID=A0A915MSA9_MELJA